MEFEPHMIIAELKNITKTYVTGDHSLQVLKNFSFTIQKGDFLAIQGRSGSGKTTLLNILGLLDTDYGGEYRLCTPENAELLNTRHLSDGMLSHLRNQMLGFVFQHFNLLDHLTCLENICIPASFSKPKPSPNDIRTTALQLLQKLGVADKADAHPNQLSGGQKQRVAIARALLLKPRLILCDEPTGALDADTSQEIMALFRDLSKSEGLAFIIVTHDQIVADACDRIIRMDAMV